MDTTCVFSFCPLRPHSHFHCFRLIFYSCRMFCPHRGTSENYCNPSYCMQHDTRHQTKVFNVTTNAPKPGSDATIRRLRKLSPPQLKTIECAPPFNSNVGQSSHCSLADAAHHGTNMTASISFRKVDKGERRNMKPVDVRYIQTPRSQIELK